MVHEEDAVVDVAEEEEDATTDVMEAEEEDRTPHCETPGYLARNA